MEPGKLLPTKQTGCRGNGYFLLVYHLELKVREMGPMNTPLVKAPALTATYVIQ